MIEKSKSKKLHADVNFLFYKPTFEFHISRKSRDKYEFNKTLFSITGEVVFSNFNASRELAQLLNQSRDPQDMVPAGELNAMGLLDEILHYLIESYRQDLNPEMFERMESFLIKNFGEEKLDELLLNFAHLFPTTSVYKNQIAAEKESH